MVWGVDRIVRRKGKKKTLKGNKEKGERKEEGRERKKEKRRGVPV